MRARAAACVSTSRQTGAGTRRAVSRRFSPRVLPAGEPALRRQALPGEPAVTPVCALGFARAAGTFGDYPGMSGGQTGVPALAGAEERSLAARQRGCATNHMIPAQWRRARARERASEPPGAAAAPAAG